MAMKPDTAPVTTPMFASGLAVHQPSIIWASVVASRNPCGTKLLNGCLPGARQSELPHAHCTSLVTHHSGRTGQSRFAYFSACVLHVFARFGLLSVGMSGKIMLFNRLCPAPVQANAGLFHGRAIRDDRSLTVSVAFRNMPRTAVACDAEAGQRFNTNAKVVGEGGKRAILVVCLGVSRVRHGCPPFFLA